MGTGGRRARDVKPTLLMNQADARRQSLRFAEALYRIAVDTAQHAFFIFQIRGDGECAAPPKACMETPFLARKE